MFFKPVKNQATGRIAYTIAESYRDENKKPRQRQILNLGFLDELDVFDTVKIPNRGCGR